MEIIEFTNEYTEEVKDMLVALQNHIVHIDNLKLNTITPEYREEYFKFAYNMSYNSGGKFFIAKENNTVLGFAACSTTSYEDVASVSYKCPKKGEITELIVTSKIRSKGVGKMLIDKMEEYFKSKNCEYIVVDVFSYNEIGKNFYTKNNYHSRLETRIKKIEK